ncbi:MAG: hypothetical protein ACRED5_06875 [Propylenella sp.]
MKAFLGGIAAMILIAVAAAVVLENRAYLSVDGSAGEPASVRLGENP